MAGRTKDLADTDVPFPLEVVVCESPVSSQSKNRASVSSWIAKVKSAAQYVIAGNRDWYYIEDRPVMVTIYYFPPTTMQGDIDNIVKPILDALIGVAYRDDRWVEKIVVQKFEPGIRGAFRAPSSILSGAVELAAPILYIRVDGDLSWRIVE